MLSYPFVLLNTYEYYNLNEIPWHIPELEDVDVLHLSEKLSNEPYNMELYNKKEFLINAKPCEEKHFSKSESVVKINKRFLPVHEVFIHNNHDEKYMIYQGENYLCYMAEKKSFRISGRKEDADNIIQTLIYKSIDDYKNKFYALLDSCDALEKVGDKEYEAIEEKYSNYPYRIYEELFIPILKKIDNKAEYIVSFIRDSYSYESLKINSNDIFYDTFFSYFNDYCEVTIITKDIYTIPHEDRRNTFKILGYLQLENEFEKKLDNINKNFPKIKCTNDNFGYELRPDLLKILPK